MGNGLGNLVACCDIRSIICSWRYVDTLGTVSDCKVYHSQQWVVLMSCEQKWASRSFIRHCSICLPSVCSWHHCTWRDLSGLLPHTYLHTVSFPEKRGSVGLNCITCQKGCGLLCRKCHTCILQLILFWQLKPLHSLVCDGLIRP